MHQRLEFDHCLHAFVTTFRVAFESVKLILNAAAVTSKMPPAVVVARNILILYSSSIIAESV